MVCGAPGGPIGVCRVFTKSVSGLILPDREDAIGVIIETPKNNMKG